MNSKGKLTLENVRHLAKLANLSLTERQLEELLPQFSNILKFVSQVQSLKTDNVEETSQITGLENVFREDIVDEKRMFSQDEALRNANRKHNGFFVVDAILENE